MIVYLIQCEPGVYLRDKWGRAGPFNGQTAIHVTHATAAKRCEQENAISFGRRFVVVPFVLQPAELLKEGSA